PLRSLTPSSTEDTMTDRATRSTPRRVLVVCTRLIGDVLLSTPLVRSLKQAWPNAEVDVLVFEGTDGVLAGNPDIHRILTTPRREPLRSKIAYLRPLW